MVGIDKEEYNGWVNYDTWLMNLNLTNEEGLYHDITSFCRNSRVDGDALKDYIEELFFDDKTGCIHICDSWDSRSQYNIVWDDIVSAFREE